MFGPGRDRHDPALGPLLVTRRLVLLALGVTLGGLAYRAAGWPTPVTFSATGLIGLMFVLSMRLAQSGSSTRGLTILGVLLGTGILALASLTADPFSLSSVQVSWIALLVVPAAVLMFQGGHDRGGLSPARLAAVCAVVLGLLSAGSWSDPGGRLLLGSLAFLALCLFTAETLAHIVSRTPVHRRRPTSTSPSVTALTRVLGLVAVLGLLVTLLAIPVLSRIPSWYQPPQADPTALGIEPDAGPGPGLDLRSPSLDPEFLLARVRRVPEEDGPLLPPGFLYLREQVLDLPWNQGDTAVLVARDQDMVLLRDGDDGQNDHRVLLQPILDSAGSTRRPRPIFAHEITIETEQQTRLLLPPHALHVDGRLMHVASDLSVQDPTSLEPPYSYRVQSDLVRYFAAASRWARAERKPSEPLPAFPELRSLQTRVIRILTGVQDDLEKARRLERAFQKRGVREGDEFWNGRHGPLLDGRVAGASVHFAQAFAIMARLAYLPARVAVGYRVIWPDQSTEMVDVRAGDRHVWAEVQFQGLGWVAFEPTPALSSPTDLEAPQDPSQAPADTGPAATGGDDRGREGITAEVGTPAADRPTTQDLLEEQESGEDPARTLLLALLTLIALVAAFWMIPQDRSTRSARRRAGDAAKPPRRARRAWKYWQQFVDGCNRAGVPKADSATAQEFVALIEPLLPDERDELHLLADTYYGCRFGSADLEPDRERVLRRWLPHVATRLRRARAKRSRPAEGPPQDPGVRPDETPRSTR